MSELLKSGPSILALHYQLHRKFQSRAGGRGLQDLQALLGLERVLPGRAAGSVYSVVPLDEVDDLLPLRLALVFLPQQFLHPLARLLRGRLERVDQAGYRTDVTGLVQYVGGDMVVTVDTADDPASPIQQWQNARFFQTFYLLVEQQPQLSLEFIEASGSPPAG